MDDIRTIVNPSSFVNISENEFENLRHVRTELHRDAKGVSLVWRFEADGNPEDSNMASSDESAPQNEKRRPEHEVLTTEQVAAELGVSPKTVRKLITKGILEAIPGVCPYKITREALNRYLCGHLPRKDPDPMADNAGSYVPPRRKARRILTGIKKSSRKPKEEEIKRAAEDMKKWDQ